MVKVWGKDKDRVVIIMEAIKATMEVIMGVSVKEKATSMHRLMLKLMEMELKRLLSQRLLAHRCLVTIKRWSLAKSPKVLSKN